MLPLFLLWIFAVTVSGQSFLQADPDKNRNTQQFIESRGFTDEFHSVVTGDGYYIGLHRLINPFRSATRQPVLLAPVSGGYSKEWLRNSPGGNANESLDVVGPNLGFEVAKRGYDTWLIDYRGTYLYSYKHTTYDLDHDLEYWDYSYDEFALFDLAAAFDYIRSVTKRDKVGYIGLIDSTIFYFFLASKVPRFNQVVQPVISVAPLFYQANPMSEADREQSMQEIRRLIRTRGQNMPQYLRNLLDAAVCNDQLTQAICNLIVYLGLVVTFPGGKVGSVNYDRLILYYTTGPTNAPSNWLIAQESALPLSDKITMLNVTPEFNIQRYGSVDPPEYFPEQITNPEMHFISSASDALYTQEKIDKLRKKLGTRLRSDLVIPESVEWSGVSYQDGAPADVSYWINTPALQILSAYNL